jgi:dipeptidyl aminopeptidase B
MAAVIGVFAALSYKGTSFQIHGTQHITMDHIFNGTFSSYSGFVRWVPEGELIRQGAIPIYLTVTVLAGDGVFATSQHGEIALVDLKSNNTTKLVTMADVKDVRELCIRLPTCIA